MTICSQYLRNVEVKLPTIHDGKVTLSKIQVDFDLIADWKPENVPPSDVQAIPDPDHNPAGLVPLRHPHRGRGPPREGRGEDRHKHPAALQGRLVQDSISM